MKYLTVTSVASLLCGSIVFLGGADASPSTSSPEKQILPIAHAELGLSSSHRRHHVAAGSDVIRNTASRLRRHVVDIVNTSAIPSKTKKTKRDSRLKNRKRSCKTSSSGSSSSSSSSSSASSGSSPSHSSDSSSDSASDSSSGSTFSNSTGSSSVSLSSSFLAKNGIYWGYLPDEADAGGSKQSMAQINQWTNSKSAFYGYYAQAPCSKTFDGSQLLSVKSDIVSSGAIFQPAVMPTGGFSCFTSDSTSNAYAIAKVMKEFTDEGVEVWLRFGHEVNWYLTDGTYQGTADGFISAWRAVAEACKSVAPDVKMFWTPNIENDAAYAKYWPGSDYVDVVGIDYYPSSTGTFVSRMQNFHDTYATGGIKFAIGETGWGKSADISTRLQYVDELTSDQTKAALPQYVGAAWFNFYKGYDFRIVTGDDSTTQQTVSFFSS